MSTRVRFSVGVSAALLALSLATSVAARPGGGGARGGGSISGGRGGMTGGGAGRGARDGGFGRGGGPRAGRGDFRVGRQRGEGRVGTFRHRDRNGDGIPDRHRHGRRPNYWYPYGGFFFGSAFYGGSSWYRSPYYDPFYNGYYGDGEERRERRRRDGDNVQVRVSPANASVYVNGLQYSSRGRGSFSLPTGRWTIELRAPGYLPQTIDLDVDQGVRYSIERRLEKDVSVTPDGQPLQQEEID